MTTVVHGRPVRIGYEEVETGLPSHLSPQLRAKLSQLKSNIRLHFHWASVLVESKLRAGSIPQGDSYQYERFLAQALKEICTSATWLFISGDSGNQHKAEVDREDFGTDFLRVLISESPFENDPQALSMIRSLGEEVQSGHLSRTPFSRCHSRMIVEYQTDFDEEDIFVTIQGGYLSLQASQRHQPRPAFLGFIVRGFVELVKFEVDMKVESYEFNNDLFETQKRGIEETIAGNGRRVRV